MFRVFFSVNFNPFFLTFQSWYKISFTGTENYYVNISQSDCTMAPTSDTESCAVISVVSETGTYSPATLGKRQVVTQSVDYRAICAQHSCQIQTSTILSNTESVDKYSNISHGYKHEKSYIILYC